ncbi:unnamed protein product [Paramecium octaurelia]|uniref:Uncharacterized protein n=1 Tax=Paramecium octaurelia TaxID=43137 RepID=A0A8S1V4L4_PAROT|nr:unnamed protein product [Paramecium octaurelia]
MKSGSSWLNAVQLNPLDFAEIDYLDPALKDGHKVLYDRILNINIRFQDRFSEVQELSQPEPIRLRVLQLVTILFNQGELIVIHNQLKLKLVQRRICSFYFITKPQLMVSLKLKHYRTCKCLLRIMLKLQQLLQIRSNKIIMDMEPFSKLCWMGQPDQKLIRQQNSEVCT